MITDDPKHPGINKKTESGQDEAYLVLSEAERARGFIRPVRTRYIHKGIRPKHNLRPLTEEESNRYAQFGYVMYEEYPKKDGIVGRYWTSAQLNSGCQTLTIMGLSIAETYAARPTFYGATFCCGCNTHHPVAEFVWEDGTVVGS